jgi:hypothetical protein
MGHKIGTYGREKGFTEEKAHCECVHLIRLLCTKFVATITQAASVQKMNFLGVEG